MKNTKYWIILFLVLLISFSILGFFGREVYRQAPPIPERFVSSTGETLWTKEDIQNGQVIWQSIGGQQIGSIWGHGSYQAPDWTADWLHRELLHYLQFSSLATYQKPFDQLSVGEQTALKAQLPRAYRTNTFQPETLTVVLSPERIRAIQETQKHYLALFGDDPAFQQLREDYAIQEKALPDPKRREKMTAFFFWTTWASATERPNTQVTYTNNWPHEPLIRNVPSSSLFLWSILSIFFLLSGVGALVWYHAFKKAEADPESIPKSDPFMKIQATPSMRAVAKYCAVVIALFVVQVLLGAVTAHYTVEGQHFYGIPLSTYLPYSLTRTWHLQTALFWIATSFLAAGLFLAPIVGGREPKYQRLGVNVLFGALVLVVAGSLLGEYLAIHQKLGLETSFWLGHQGYEYIDLGKFWQIALYGGLLLWLGLMLRALWPALMRPNPNKELITLFVGASAAIGLFYGAGLFIGAKTHLSVMEYWRWWVVHLWVEGFMEVFATVSMAFIFTYLGLVRPQTASRSVLFSASIFLVSGIPGTFHHLYFSGTPVSIMAIGASFSALEVIPLILMGLEAWETARLGKLAPWMSVYRWPIRFFIGVCFWNFVGAGLFGFMINPPIALYYMQGLNTTAVHAHTATFGVYGLLSLGLILLILRWLKPNLLWNERPLAIAFWSMNLGLALMVGLSLLPVGLLQASASVDQGLWFARSSEFLQQPHIEVLRWLRIVGDSLFLFGVAALTWFVVRWFLTKNPESVVHPELDEANKPTRSLEEVF